jgi:hypothetical protein
MASLKLTVSDTAPSVKGDILADLCQKLAEYEYKPTGVVSADASADVHHLEPCGAVWIELTGNTFEVKLHSVDLDKKDLFTSVLADLEQRIDGLTGEID